MKKMPDRKKSLEDLEGVTWPEPPPSATGLVRTVYALRKSPIGSLNPHELARMIGQDVGVPLLLPLALEILRDTAQEQPGGGFYDDDLLTAVLTRRADTWRNAPDLAAELQDILLIIDETSPYIQSSIRKFFETINGTEH